MLVLKESINGKANKKTKTSKAPKNAYEAKTWLLIILLLSGCDKLKFEFVNDNSILKNSYINYDQTTNGMLRYKVPF